MPTPPPRSPTSRSTLPEDGHEPVTLYTIVMTPVNFASFLISLLLVDIHYTRMRMHTHAESRSKVPNWLHNLLYYRHPYEAIRRKYDDVHEPWYYHSKQKKLMKMEVEDAFRLRGSVMVGIAVAAAVATIGTLYSLKLLVSQLLG